jgi:D-alanine-D-alanine ligase
VCVDVLVTAGENEYVLEVNTQPVLTPDGLFARAAAQKGYDFGALCDSMLDGGRLYQSARRRPNVESLMPSAYRQTNAVAPVALLKSVG